MAQFLLSFNSDKTRNAGGQKLLGGVTMSGWIGVDLDGTLAHHDHSDRIHDIGRPIPSMFEKVKLLLRSGIQVKIFTARAAYGRRQIKMIQDWLAENGLPRLEVTNKKDLHLIEIWDDRAVQVVRNAGRFARSNALSAT